MPLVLCCCCVVQCSSRCCNIASEWSYSVEFGGVGSPPDEWSHVGHCSQYAVFRRLQNTDAYKTPSTGLIYERVCYSGYTRFQFSYLTLGFSTSVVFCIKFWCELLQDPGYFYKILFAILLVTNQNFAS